MHSIFGVRSSQVLFSIRIGVRFEARPGLYDGGGEAFQSLIWGLFWVFGLFSKTTPRIFSVDFLYLRRAQFYIVNLGT